MSVLTEEISIEEITTFLEETYGIKGTVALIYGELDLNYKVSTEDHSYLFKVFHPNTSLARIDLQNSIIAHLTQKGLQTIAQVVLTKKNEALAVYNASTQCYARLQTWIEGRLWSAVNPITTSLRIQLGERAGEITTGLSDLNATVSTTSFDWDIAQGLWVKNHLHLFDDAQLRIITPFITAFENGLPGYNQLPKSIIHNDVNDNNIIVSNDLLHPCVTGIIDFGDTIYSQRINDLGITCAYAIMHCENPLEAAREVIKGYHHTCTLSEQELAHVYNIIAMRLVISVTKSAINKNEHPENTYLQVSEEGAWALLKKWSKVNAEFAHYAFRKACDYDAHPDVKAFNTWAASNTFSLKGLFPSIGVEDTHHLDLSVGSPFIGTLQDMNNLELFQFKIDQLQKTVPNKLLVGGYCEPRTLYTSSAYDRTANQGTESRTVHIGLDVWLPALTPVHALFDGEVVTACNDEGDKEYGGLVILKHTIDTLVFYTLYGHNTVDSALQHKVGDRIKKGAKIAELGDPSVNGNWAPHLHFQIMLSMLDYAFDFPGVAFKSELDIWKDLCPNPDLLFKQNLPDNEAKYNVQALLNYRESHLGKGLSLHYNKPLHIARGSGAYLIDVAGKKYLDTVNNVAHVGHEHPSVVAAGQQQMALLNTNTRYLYKHINGLTKALLKTVPETLSVVHYVNSGSEANELAIRMVQTITQSKEIIASQIGYHGNTNMCVAISSYKFDGKGGSGAPDHTHIFAMPDTFRGKHQGPDAAERYADEVQQCIDTINHNNKKVGGFIMEPVLSCGGQIVPPKGFLKLAYQKVRNAGGICISDEVQTGLGRMGNTFWGFQLHDVIPDIITIGKPFGNGHPVAAVICTQKVAEAFANGMEFFNTFGGNPVSCAIAKSVLEVIDQASLQKNASEVGGYLKDQLVQLSKEHTIIGDVRGQGLFLGFELVNGAKNPLPEQTTYLVNRMQEFGVLMSSDGPDHNVIKIKPPMIFTKEHATLLVSYLDRVLSEDYMKAYE